ncbi:MAG: glycerate kinase, partial [Actinomycetota bacterium]|nr:glycerate kinase [Actinomycetota bacterium]
LGAQLVPGFEVVAEAVDLGARLEGADLVVTGEGLLDQQSFNGKAIGGVLALAAEVGVPALVVVGEAEDQLDRHDPPGRPPVHWVSLVERFGRDRAMGDTLACIERAVADYLGR